MRKLQYAETLMSFYFCPWKYEKRILKENWRIYFFLNSTDMADHSGSNGNLYMYLYTVKLGDKEQFNKEQIGVKKPFSITNLPIF